MPITNQQQADQAQMSLDRIRERLLKGGQSTGMQSFGMAGQQPQQTQSIDQYQADQLKQALGRVQPYLTRPEPTPTPQTNFVQQQSQGIPNRAVQAQQKDDRAPTRKIADALNSFFGGGKIGDAIGTAIAKGKLGNTIQKLVIGRDLTPEEEALVGEGPSTAQVVGDVARVGLNFLPVGKLATGTKAGLTALKVAPAIAKPVGNLLTMAGTGYAADVATGIAEGDSIGQALKPGAGTAISTALGFVPIVGPSVSKLGKNVSGMLTGTSYGTLDEFAKAVRSGGSVADEAMKSLRGKVDSSAIVDEARGALDAMKASRSQAYRDQFSKLTTGSQTVYDINGIKNKVVDELAKFKVKQLADGSLDFSQSALKFNKQAQSDIQNIVSGVLDTPGNLATAEQLDITKQALDDLWTDSGKARAMVQSIKSEFSKTLNNIPGWAKLNKDYAQSSALINEIQRGLSLGDKAATDTAFRKLTTALRTNNEFRQQLLQEINEVAGGDLIPKIAGQQLSEILPRGIMGRLAGGAAGLSGVSGGLSLLPLVKAFLVTSPRVAGEILGAAGVAGRNADKVIKLLVAGKGALRPSDFIITKTALKAASARRKSTTEGRQ